MKYRKKPVVIEAIQWKSTFESYNEICNFVGYSLDNNHCGQDEPQEIYIKTLEGVHTATKGDYIIKGVKGEFYPCKHDIFEMTYEKVESIQQLEHEESPDCWCGPTLIQAIDNEHDCEVWSHKGYEELNQ